MKNMKNMKHPYLSILKGKIMEKRSSLKPRMSKEEHMAKLEEPLIYEDW